MNKKILLSKKIIIPFLLVFLVTALTLGIFNFIPKIQEYNIKNEIQKANYCTIDSDCVDAGGKCPFGCYAYVNKNEVQRISNLINSFESKCVYGCITCQSAQCINNTCVEVCE